MLKCSGILCPWIVSEIFIVPDLPHNTNIQDALLEDELKKSVSELQETLNLIQTQHEEMHSDIAR